jgi:hypothetical protein
LGFSWEGIVQKWDKRNYNISERVIRIIGNGSTWFWNERESEDRIGYNMRLGISVQQKESKVNKQVSMLEWLQNYSVILWSNLTIARCVK